VRGLELTGAGENRPRRADHETLILMNFYPLENAGFAGRMQSDNPQIVAAVTQLNA
jgi:hypothetical protein